MVSMEQFNAMKQELEQNYRTAFLNMQQEFNNKIAQYQQQTLMHQKEKEKNKNITIRREFADVPVYGGKSEEFENWKFKIRTYLADEVGFTDLLLKLDSLLREPTENEMLDILETMGDPPY